MSSPPSVNRSLSSATFGQQVDAASAAAAQGQLSMDADFVDAALQEKVDDAEARAGGLMNIPVASMQYDGLADEGVDDGLRDKLKEAYGNSCNTLSCHMKNLYAEKHTKLSDESLDPFEVTEKMALMVQNQEESEQKNSDIRLMNIDIVLFEEARKNPALRDFLAEQFGALKVHYDKKERRAELDEHLKILEELYNEKELETAMRVIKDKQDARKLALEDKGKAKAEKMAAAADEKAAKKQKK
tara:strand:+ start:1408 stop:2136 length:729 start_codon:yes stop_codon:yes gene_type:complete